MGERHVGDGVRNVQILYGHTVSSSPGGGGSFHIYWAARDGPGVGVVVGRASVARGTVGPMPVEVDGA